MSVIKRVFPRFLPNASLSDFNIGMLHNFVCANVPRVEIPTKLTRQQCELIGGLLSNMATTPFIEFTRNTAIPVEEPDGPWEERQMTLLQSGEEFQVIPVFHSTKCMEAGTGTDPEKGLKSILYHTTATSSLIWPTHPRENLFMEYFIATRYETKMDGYTTALPFHSSPSKMRNLVLSQLIVPKNRTFETVVASDSSVVKNTELTVNDPTYVKPCFVLPEVRVSLNERFLDTYSRLRMVEAKLLGDTARGGLFKDDFLTREEIPKQDYLLMMEKERR